MKKFIVIAYDIADDKKRTEVSDLLAEYGGSRVNRSVFECFLNEREFTKIRDALAGKIKHGEDSVLYYHLCKDCLGKIQRQGIENKGRNAVKLF